MFTGDLSLEQDGCKNESQKPEEEAFWSKMHSMQTWEGKC